MAENIISEESIERLLAAYKLARQAAGLDELGVLNYFEAADIEILKDKNMVMFKDRTNGKQMFSLTGETLLALVELLR